MTHRLRYLAASSVLIALPLHAGSIPDADADAINLVTSCQQCHRDGDASIPGWPPLAALSKEELIAKLTTYRNERVPESRMSDVTHNFTDQDIERIAEHFAQ